MAKTYRVIPALTAQEQERFWNKVDKTPGQGPNKDCWIWIAGKRKHGYGVYRVREVIMFAHRVACFLACEQFDNTLAVCHSCDNRLCCNPVHLWQGTHKDNSQDMASKGRHWMKQHPEQIRRGDTHGYTKIPDAEISKIRAECASARGIRREIAARYGVSKGCIDAIVQRRTRKHIP